MKNYEKKIPCDNCNGDGYGEAGYFAEPYCEFVPTHVVECGACDGTGEILVPKENISWFNDWLMNNLRKHNAG